MGNMVYFIGNFLIVIQTAYDRAQNSERVKV